MNGYGASQNETYKWPPTYMYTCTLTLKHTHSPYKKWKTTCTCTCSKHKEAKKLTFKSLEASNNDSTVYGHTQILSNVIRRSGFTSTLSITAGTTQLCGLWNYIHVHIHNIHVGMHALYMYILMFISKSIPLLKGISKCMSC